MRKRRELGLVDKVGDMTSMIDVVFLLLIFFILMPFKTSESRLESHLPKNSGPSIKSTPDPVVEKIDIRVTVNKDVAMNPQNFEGVSVSINGKKLSNFTSLKNRLEELRAGVRGDPAKIPVELNADEDVPFYFIMKGLDYAKINNFSYIKFPEKPKSNSRQRPRRNQ